MQNHEDMSKQNEKNKSDQADIETEYIIENSQLQSLGGFSGCLLSCLPFVRNNLWFQMGYVMNLNSIMSTSSQLPDSEWPFDVEKTFGWSLGITVTSLSSVAIELGMVRPYVKIHLVDIRSGRYLRMKKTAYAIPPLITKSCFLKDISALPSWDQDIIVDAPFSAVASPNTLILLEILDTRTPLNIKKNAGKI